MIRSFVNCNRYMLQTDYRAWQKKLQSSNGNVSFFQNALLKSYCYYYGHKVSIKKKQIHDRKCCENKLVNMEATTLQFQSDFEQITKISQLMP